MILDGRKSIDILPQFSGRTVRRRGAAWPVASPGLEHAMARTGARWSSSSGLERDNPSWERGSFARESRRLPTPAGVGIAPAMPANLV
jgi:hypothetical protein